MEKKNIIEDFAVIHPEVYVDIYMLDFTNSTQQAFHQAVFESLGLTPGLGAILNRSGEICVLYLESVTTSNLERWLAGDDVCQPTSLMPWVAFLAGLAIGASACVLLLLGTIGTAVTSATTRRHYTIISTGLVLGVLAGYVVIGAFFTWFVISLDFLNALKYIFAVALLIIGIWQILDFKREKSIIFGTPGKVKDAMKRLISGKTGTGAFVVGLMFALIKIPCFGGPFLAIVYGARDDPTLFLTMIVYFAGMFIPYIVILVAIGMGLSSERINNARLKYRPHLRLLSGAVLIMLVVYLIIF
ncbi:MAG: cytochrome c biogenesis CcdA family protein [Candidatus Sigynarchaeota archaeon]